MSYKSEIYRLLENKMLKYQDLIGVKVNENNEKFVKLETSDNLSVKQIDNQMLKYTRNQIFVRCEVANKLTQVARMVRQLNSRSKLQIVYGYRPIEVQTSLFYRYYKQLEDKTIAERDKLEAVHRLIAVPEVSGHPTGGAVDVQILLGKSSSLGFGTKIWEFKPDSYTFSPFISNKSKLNRMLLRNLMLKNGFAPFDGEWWHFSYGDREWAKYYNKNYAIYNQITFDNLRI